MQLISKQMLADKLNRLEHPRVTEKEIKDQIERTEFLKIGETKTHCSIVLKNGFSVSGESACVSPENYDKEIGERIAYDNAFQKLWALFGFLLAETLHGRKELSEEKFGFGAALELMLKGEAVQRSGWNGKGMFIYHVPDGKYKSYSDAAKRLFGEDSFVPYGAYLAMKTAQGNVVPWLASQTDILAEDWSIYAA